MIIKKFEFEFFYHFEKNSFVLAITNKNKIIRTIFQFFQKIKNVLWLFPKVNCQKKSFFFKKNY